VPLLSVNVNKIALLRNSRGGNRPDLYQAVRDILSYGAHGITVHPRPDERHVRFADLPVIADIVARHPNVEFNVEGYPSPKTLEWVEKVRPHQYTLVPDPPGALTSDAGWGFDDPTLSFLTATLTTVKSWGVRTSLFVDANDKHVASAASVGADRIELYTGPYAHHFHRDRAAAVAPYLSAARKAHELGLGINAGHDLDLQNLNYFVRTVPNVAEVSIGHALISDALYFGLQETVKRYLAALK
jgi:pyridoxine 5-phosphate synthase